MYFCKINSTPCCLSENIAYLCKVVQTTDIYSWCVSLTPCIRNLVNFKMEAGLSSNTCHMYPYANDMRYRCGVLFSFICFRVLPEPLIQISKPAPHLNRITFYIFLIIRLYIQNSLWFDTAKFPQLISFSKKTTHSINPFFYSRNVFFYMKANFVCRKCSDIAKFSVIL